MRSGVRWFFLRCPLGCLDYEPKTNRKLAFTFAKDVRKKSSSARCSGGAVAAGEANACERNTPWRDLATPPMLGNELIFETIREPRAECGIFRPRCQWLPNHQRFWQRRREVGRQDSGQSLEVTRGGLGRPDRQRHAASREAKFRVVPAGTDEPASARICLLARRFIGGLAGMGAKYLPTIKDLKASQRFQQKQQPLHKFKKTPGPSAKKTKKT